MLGPPLGPLEREHWLCQPKSTGARESPFRTEMRAFRHYKPTSEGGELVLRHEIGQEATAAALSREQQAKNHLACV